MALIFNWILMVAFPCAVLSTLAGASFMATVFEPEAVNELSAFKRTVYVFLPLAAVLTVIGRVVLLTLFSIF